MKCKNLLSLLGLVLFTLSGYAVAQSRIPVSLENNTAAALVNYSARIEVNAVSAPGFNFSNNGDDLVVWNSDFTAQLDFYVESVDPIGETAVIWIEVPSVPVSPPNTAIFLDYNRADVTSPLSDLNDTFVTPGFKFHTQLHTDADPGPESLTAGEAAFDFDTVAAPGSGYGCTPLTALTGVDNSGVFGANGDIGFFIETFFFVPTGALFEFRLGPDFGHGGELYLDGSTLEDNWSGNLWWAGSYASSSVLNGVRFLDAGAHTLKALGFERCCDGQMGFEYRFDSDGDGDLSDESFTDLTSTSPGLSIVAPSCPVANVNLGPITTVPVTLSKFSSTKAGPFLKLEWETADETFNAGFDIWTVSENEQGAESLSQLNRKIVRSNRFDSAGTQIYRHNLTLREELNKVVISSIDFSGQQEFFGPFDIGESYGAEHKSEPIDWVALRDEHERLMRAKGFVRTKSGWRNSRTKSSRQDAESAAVTISHDGVYRVTHADLLAVGVSLTGARKGHIAVLRDGVGVPRRVGGPKGAFGPGGFIDFVGVSSKGEQQIYSSDSVFQIALDPAQARPIRRINRSPENLQTWRYKTVTFDEDKHYVMSNPGSSPWLQSVMFRSAQAISTSLDFDIVNINTVAPEQVTLTLDVAGLSNLPGIDVDGDAQDEPDHSLEVYINNQLVKRVEWEGQAINLETLTFDPDLLQAGKNTVTLTAQDNGYIFDAIGIDSVALSYAVFESVANFEQPQSEFDGLLFEHAGRRKPIAYAYRLDGNLMRLAVRRVKGERGKLTLPFVANGAAHMFVGDAKQLKRPDSIDKLLPPAQFELQDADMLVISHPQFIVDTLQDYLQQRNLDGVESLVFSTDVIQRNFGVSVPLHEAIKRFLQTASKKIEFSSVLLVGGHSYDYKNTQNQEVINFIPTFYRPIGFSRFTPSDQPFVDFDNDGYPEKAIGRWPVRSLSELQVITDKSAKWAMQSKQRSTQGHQLLLMADRQRDLDFDSDLDQQLNILQQGDLVFAGIDKVYIDEFDADPTVPADQLNGLVQMKVTDSIASGASWLMYNGHGSRAAWSATAMLSSQQIPNLDNVDYPFAVASLGCYTSYYEHPSNDSLAHQLLFSGNNGAAMIHGPAVVGGYARQLRLFEQILKHSGTGQSIGDAVYEGMRSLPVNYANAILNWALLADPSLPVQ